VTLGVATRTVKSHIAKVASKLQAHSEKTGHRVRLAVFGKCPLFRESVLAGMIIVEEASYAWNPVCSVCELPYVQSQISQMLGWLRPRYTRDRTTTSGHTITWIRDFEPLCLTCRRCGTTAYTLGTSLVAATRFCSLESMDGPFSQLAGFALPVATHLHSLGKSESC
jgi:hypothetical protein